MFSLNKDRELIINIHVAYHIKFPDKVYNFALNEADFISGVFEILQLILTACKWIYFDNPILLLGVFYVIQFRLMISSYNENYIFSSPGAQ